MAAAASSGSARKTTSDWSASFSAENGSMTPSQILGEGGQRARRAVWR
jgi:hypothetical protein